MTYQIEWYVEGKKKKTETPFCKPERGKAENSNPCPDDNEIRSLLRGSTTHENYEPGQWVRRLYHPFLNNSSNTAYTYQL